MSKKTPNTTAARYVGRGLAHVQNLIDDIIDWGFGQVKTASEQPLPKPKKNENKYVYKAKALGMTALKFIGEAGSEYYNQYNELKQKKMKS